MRKTVPDSQRRFDLPSITEVRLNYECRDEMIPILRALQHLYSQKKVLKKILNLIARDVNADTRPDVGRSGMSYWEILVLAAVRLGCNLDYDKLQDLAENHRNLRALLGVGSWDETTSFNWRRIRENICLLKPETIEAINEAIVEEGERLAPEAAETARGDSFVVETCIHYPTESSLLYDGVRTILRIAVPMAEAHRIPGWRQHEHLLKQAKRLNHRISRIAASESSDRVQRLKAAYAKLLKLVDRVVRRARELLQELGLPAPTDQDVFGPNNLQAFVARTQRVRQTAYRRVIRGERVPNAEKLFSMFEPHTQLYKRGKASQPVQFGRLLFVYENGAGFITQYRLLSREEGERDVVVDQTRRLQDRLGGRVRLISLDRGFHSPEVQRQLAEIVPCVSLRKPGARQWAEQEAEASEEFLAGQQAHPGVESAIGSLQSGNGLERCRDRCEVGLERYVGLGILGRNLHTLGRLLIAREDPLSEAAFSRRSG